MLNLIMNFQLPELEPEQSSLMLSKLFEGNGLFCLVDILVFTWLKMGKCQ